MRHQKLTVTELIAEKQMILDKLTNGHWVLDLLSPSILKKITEDQKFLNAKSEITDITLKSYAIFYYCHLKSPLTILFYDKVIDQNFNQIILNKIAKAGFIDNFSYEEQEKIVDSLNQVQRLGTTGFFQFVKELSFIKMNSMQFRSATTPHLIGAIILTTQVNYCDSYELSRSIVHELAHHELFLINFYDRLTLEKTDGVNVFSPYQKIERPRLEDSILFGQFSA